MRNTKTNINTNKLNVNDMNNQMSSQKKIALPSDDPVIAVRALRLRSNLGELDQYLHTNIEQADSWLDITETAISNISSLLNKIYDCCVQGANDTLNQDDRNAILAQLKQNQDQIYSEGNTDYAGRTVFTGYKTNAPLTYTKDAPDDHYEIDQRLSFEDLQENRYIYNEVSNSDITNYDNGAMVDYGSGKGRVPIYISYKTGCRALGIEIMSEFYEKALSNLSSYSKLFPGKGNKVSFLQHSAQKYKVSYEVNRIFFFNPFSVEILRSAVQNILVSYYENQRSILLFFYYPQDEYIAYLTGINEISFQDEIDCTDLFPEKDGRNRIMIFEI